MLERFDPVLKFVCGALALLLVYQVPRFALAKNPLKDLNIPATLTSASGPATPTSPPGHEFSPAPNAGKN